MTHTTLAKLKLKASNSSARMPSIPSICKMLTEFGIEFRTYGTVHTVESRSAGCRYVNERREGKSGYTLAIKEINLDIDSTHTYYSWNNRSYARQIVDLLASKGIS